MPASPLPDTAPPRVGTEFILLIALMMGVTALSIDIMLPALPAIEAHYDLAGENDQQLVIVSYMIGFGIGQLVFGPFSDRYGRKPVLYFGMAMYMAATVLAATAAGFDTHLAGRVLQGMAAGAARTVAVAIVRDRFAGRAMARVMSFVMTIFIMVPVVAPAIGAGILLIGLWQDMFWFLLGVAAILTVWLGLRLEETRPEAQRAPLTLRSLAAAGKAILTDRQTLCYTAVVSLLFGPLLAYIAGSHQIFVGLYGVDEWFPAVFGGIVLFSIAATLTNARLVAGTGMRRLSHGALLAQLVLAVAISAAALAGQPSLILFLAFLGLSMFAFGLCFPNFNTLAMEPHGAIAGAASSIVGFFSTAVGSVIGWGIGAAFDGTVLPLSLGFAVCAGLGLLIVLVAEPGRFMKKTI